MAKIISITYGCNISIKKADYQYVKPYISMTAELSDSDNANTALNELKNLVDNKLKDLADDSTGLKPVDLNDIF